MTELNDRVTDLESRMNGYHPASIFQTPKVIDIGRGLNLRKYPPDGEIVYAMPYGTLVHISDEVINSNGLVWVHAEHETAEGWIVQGWCAKKYLDDLYISTPDAYDTDNLAKDFPLAYIMPDDRHERVDGWGGGPSYPMTVVLWNTQHDAQNALRMKRYHYSYFDALNISQGREARHNAHNIESGIFNGQPQHDWEHPENIPDEELPRNEPITSGCNYIAVSEILPWGVVPFAFQRGDAFPNVKNLGLDNGILVNHHFSAIHEDYHDAPVDISSPTGVPSTVINPLVGEDGKDPVIKFVDKFCDDRIWMFPDTLESDYYLTAKWNIPIRTGPSVTNEKVGALPVGKDFRVHYFYPTSTGIWCKHLEGYSALGYLPIPGMNYVEWATLEFSIPEWMPLRPW